MVADPPLDVGEFYGLDGALPERTRWLSVSSYRSRHGNEVVCRRAYG